MTIAKKGQPETADQLMDELGLAPEKAHVLMRLIDQRIAEATTVRREDVLLDVVNVARMLKVSRRTVETLIACDELRPIWIGGQRRFTRQAMATYVRSRAEAPSRRLRRVA